MNIHIATDHAGFEMKESLKKYLAGVGHNVTDHGAFSYDANDDYPDYIIPCAQAVADDEQSFGIILGGSGEGEQITANKVPGIRAIEYYGGSLEIVKLGREHNDANILSLGARFMDTDEAITAVELFINTKFTGDERHVRRIEKIEQTGTVSLTFDDGWISHFNTVLPILDSYNFKGNFYIISNSNFNFENGIRMNYDQIRIIQDHGHEIGSHTQTHPNLLFTLPKKAKREISEAKKDLEKEGLNITSFCYPFGFLSPWIKKWVMNAGYSNAVSCFTGNNTTRTDQFLLRREFVMWNTDINKIKQKIKKAQKDGTWIILMFHQVEQEYHKYGTTPEKLREICDYIKSIDIPVVSVSSNNL